MSRFEYVVGGNAEKGAQAREGGKRGLYPPRNVLRNRGFGYADGLRDFGFRLSGLFDFLRDYVAKEQVERIVIGEPKQADGSPSENMARVVQFVNRWRKAFPEIPIEFYDERFTSVLAHRAMIDGGLHKKKRQDKALVDEISATIILQSYLESVRGKR